MSRHRLALLALGAAAAVVLVLVATGVVRMPDVKGALTDLSDTLGAWTYALVAGLAFLETGAFVGLVAPGETAIVLGGVVAAQGGVSLPVILVVAWLAAAAGDLASYTLGRRLGRRFLETRGPRLGVSAKRLETVDRFFARHGGKAILIGRFIGIVRAVAPFTAGASRLPLRGFLPWSILGTAVWASAFTLLGYVFNESFAAAADVLTHGAFALAIVAAAVIAIRALLQKRAGSNGAGSTAVASPAIS
jgi:membrane protein DedA with SNARE-associated domain